jgi:hypothetical protein
LAAAGQVKFPGNWQGSRRLVETAGMIRSANPRVAPHQKFNSGAVFLAAKPSN